MSKPHRRTLLLAAVLAVVGAVAGALVSLNSPEIRTATFSSVITVSWATGLGAAGAAEDIAISLSRRVDSIAVPELQARLRSENREALPAVGSQVEGSRLDAVLSLYAAAPSTQSESLMKAMELLRARVSGMLADLDNAARADLGGRVKAAEQRVAQLKSERAACDTYLEAINTRVQDELRGVEAVRMQLQDRTQAQSQALQQMLTVQMKALASINPGLAEQVGGKAEAAQQPRPLDGVTQAALDNIARLKMAIQDAARDTVAQQLRHIELLQSIHTDLAQEEREHARTVSSLEASLAQETASLARDRTRLEALVPAITGDVQLSAPRRANLAALALLGAIAGALAGVIVARAPAALRNGSVAAPAIV